MKTILGMIAALFLVMGCGSHQSVQPKPQYLVFDSVHSVTVNYNLSLAEMIEAGHYDRGDADITVERFPVKGESTQKLAVELVHFNRAISSENTIQELDAMGLRPATIEELLAFGAAFPDLQRKFPIVALGSSSIIRGNRLVPCLYEDDSMRRRLNLYWGDIGWDGYYRFLAVRK